MYLRCKYTRPDLDVDYYPGLLNKELADKWTVYLETVFPKEHKRTSMAFGDPGLIYRVQYRDVTNERLVLPWESLPALPELKSLIEKITKQTYNVCIIQCYPNGKVGIAPHRDKEIKLGDKIAGVSFGAIRTLQFTRTQHDTLNIRLNSGSTYVMNSTTNQKWLHSITRQSEVKEARYSLTFRTYKQ